MGHFLGQKRVKKWLQPYPGTMYLTTNLGHGLGVPKKGVILGSKMGPFWDPLLTGTRQTRVTRAGISPKRAQKGVPKVAQKWAKKWPKKWSFWGSWDPQMTPF